MVDYTDKSRVQAFHSYIFKGNGNQFSLGKVSPKLLHDKMQKYLNTVCLKWNAYLSYTEKYEHITKEFI